jgi:hypothetical protein
VQMAPVWPPLSMICMLVSLTRRLNWRPQRVSFGRYEVVCAPWVSRHVEPHLRGNGSPSSQPGSTPFPKDYLAGFVSRTDSNNQSAFQYFRDFCSSDFDIARWACLSLHFWRKPDGSPSTRRKSIQSCLPSNLPCSKDFCGERNAASRFLTERPGFLSYDGRGWPSYVLDGHEALLIKENLASNLPSNWVSLSTRRAQCGKSGACRSSLS